VYYTLYNAQYLGTKELHKPKLRVGSVETNWRIRELLWDVQMS
jgi:hypothetical protein